MARIDSTVYFLHRALQHFMATVSFRTGQEEIISEILHGQPVLAVLSYGCRQEHLLSAAFAAAEGRDAGNLAADIADEGCRRRR